MLNLFLFTALLAIGLFFLVAGILRLPTRATKRAMTDSGKDRGRFEKSVEALLLKGAVKIAPFLPMDEFKKARLGNTLRAAGILQTPEVYTANALLKSVVVLLGMIPCFVVFPLLSPIILFLGIAVYFKEMGKAEEQLGAKRDKIERDLPRFVATITEELKHSRDVLTLLENFKRNAGREFKAELDIVCADMRSSSYETALTRFEARINSPQLSDVVRGLIGVLRGDDSMVYFQMLSHDFKQLELQRLKAEAQKIPSKIRIFSFIMLLCFLFTYLAIIVFEILKSLTGML